ncbi:MULTISPECIES: DUF3718 domain-containing protein [Shewanella]|uniref:DUF3718 domain-containing protein n=1 Tax=Shewanella TaxID=22 RepID=UPI0011830DCC|nr:MULTISPECIES: DUF3718 domain-containing protein [Shewanella]QYJ91777.1 DUF3718 domain-containing protein [Shewanella halotolerans]TVP09972.1 hypothetical protein AYI87_18915 [Shewanella sp. KCT]
MKTGAFVSIGVAVTALGLGLSSQLAVAEEAAAAANTSTNTNANYRFVAQDSSAETKICIAAGSDNSSALKRKLVNYDHNMRFGVNSISCNGVSLAQFAHQYQASQSFQFLERHSSIANRVKTKVSITDLASNRSGGGEPIVVMVSAK